MSLFPVVMVWLSTGAAIELFARVAEERARWKGWP